jgi:small nuclear ribonucleoprotein (snRNP)-like protein
MVSAPAPRLELHLTNHQLPLGLLTAAQGQPMLVELKDGETLNGHLVSCDTWMNLVLREVVQTSPDGENFFRLPEVYVRGNNVGLFQLWGKFGGLIGVID